MDKIDLFNKKYHIDARKMNYSDKVNELLNDGVTSIPIYTEEQLPRLREIFDETMKNFPEYLPDAKVYVLGGFAALGNPASFHNDFVRDIRLDSSLVAKDFFTSVCKKDNFYMQTMPDRMMNRLKGQSATAEAWHRDILAKGNEKDDIYGGWINLDSSSQFFSYIPGSHTNLDHVIKSGFATLADEVPDPVLRKSITDRRKLFEVKPGHMIIFPQYILHEVLSKKAKHDMKRLFTGWRLSKTQQMLYPEKVFEDQGVFHLPGGMMPPMYSMNHISRFKSKKFNIGNGITDSLITWSSSTFKPVAIEEKTGSDGVKYQVVNRHMESLASMKLPMYKRYSEEEMKIYRGIKLF